MACGAEQACLLEPCQVWPARGVSEREVRGGLAASAGPLCVSGTLGSSVDRAQPVTAVEDVGPPERCCQQLEQGGDLRGAIISLGR